MSHPAPDSVRIEEVRSFWEQNPVCAAGISHPLGSREYFLAFDALRELEEPPAFGRQLHEWDRCAGKKVLDVGCGNGFVLSRYARQGAEVYGVDLTQTGIELCRKRFELFGLRGDFRQGNAEALPFDDDAFDYVCSMGVLHHTPDTEQAIDEVFRVLRPGGRLIVMFYHRNSALYRFKIPILRRLTGKSIQVLVNEVDGTGNPKGDVYSKAELRALLHRFRDVELTAGALMPRDVFPARLISGEGLVPRVGNRLARIALAPFERSLGFYLYAKGTKP